MQQIRCIAYLMIIVLPAASGFGQSFTKITGGPIPADGGYTQGSSWIDYDNDGDEDLFLTNGSGTIAAPIHVNFLYQNEGGGVFIKNDNTAITSLSSNYSGSAWGDFDHDGYDDVFITRITGPPNQLFRNTGSGYFETVSGPWDNTHLFSNGCSWVDYDNDGDLDIYVLNANFERNHLYRNDLNGFTQITTGLPVTDYTSSISAGWADYDNDGDMDVITANFNILKLYKNHGSAGFSDSVLHISWVYFTATWGDYDNDTYLDLYVTHVANQYGPNLLFHNDGNGGLELVSGGAIANDSMPRSGGASWGDFDNDGDLDLFATNVDAPENFYYLNDGAGNFIRVTGGALYENRGWGCTSADYDDDGDLDLIVTDGLFVSPFENYLYRNDGNANNWLKLKLKGVISNTTAIGARVLVKAHINGQDVWQLREIAQQTSYNGHNSLIAHFGLGDATVADSLVVFWPATNLTQIFTNVLANRKYGLAEFDTLVVGIGDKTAPTPSQISLSQNYPNPFNPTTTIAYSLATAAKVRLTVYNLLGQPLRTLVNQYQSAGERAVVWDGRDHAGRPVSSGIYIYQLQAGNEVQSRKMLLVR